MYKTTEIFPMMRKHGNWRARSRSLEVKLNETTKSMASLEVEMKERDNRINKQKEEIQRLKEHISRNGKPKSNRMESTKETKDALDIVLATVDKYEREIVVLNDAVEEERQLRKDEVKKQKDKVREAMKECGWHRKDAKLMRTTIQHLKVKLKEEGEKTRVYVTRFREKEAHDQAENQQRETVKQKHRSLKLQMSRLKAELTNTKAEMTQKEADLERLKDKSGEEEIHELKLKLLMMQKQHNAQLNSIRVQMDLRKENLERIRKEKDDLRTELEMTRIQLASIGSRRRPLIGNKESKCSKLLTQKKKLRMQNRKLKRKVKSLKARSDFVMKKYTQLNYPDMEGMGLDKDVLIMDCSEVVSITPDITDV